MTVLLSEELQRAIEATRGMPVEEADKYLRKELGFPPKRLIEMPNGGLSITQEVKP